VTRVVDLLWRLRRAAQDRNEAFGAMYERHTAGAPEPQDAGERGATLGRMVLNDFLEEAVLERLQRYERRIESSLYRTLNELRRLREQSRKPDKDVAPTLERWLEEDWEAKKSRAFARQSPQEVSQEPPDGTAKTTKAAEPRDSPSLRHAGPAPDSAMRVKSCKTNPISESEEKPRVPGEEVGRISMG
jgi:hypothetical protein